MVSAGAWQTARLVIAVLIVWCLVTLGSILVEEQSCDSFVGEHEQPEKILETEIDTKNILPGLTSEERVAALKDTQLDPVVGQSSKDNELEEPVATKNIWNDIRIGMDYICCYRDPSDINNNVGRPFPMTDYIRNIWFKYMRSAPVNIKTTKPVAVTALSDSHMKEFEMRISSFLAKHPGKKVLIFDLGLSKENIKRIKAKGHQYAYRKFDFGKYPEHVKNLENFAWKILVWAEVLEHYGALIYFDTSIEWTESTSHTVAEMRTNSECYKSVIKETGHTIAYGVHPMMYTFFPSNVTSHMYPYNMMKMAGGVIMFNTNDCKDNLLRWAILCALNADCIAPQGSRKTCPPGTNKYQPHICHRYDQALMSILLANQYGVKEDSQQHYHVGKETLGRPNRL